MVNFQQLSSEGLVPLFYSTARRDSLLAVDPGNIQVSQRRVNNTSKDDGYPRPNVASVANNLHGQRALIPYFHNCSTQPSSQRANA